MRNNFDVIVGAVAGMFLAGLLVMALSSQRMSLSHAHMIVAADRAMTPKVWR